MARYGDLDSQYFDDAGNPLVNGRIYFYETGTTTPKTTYADVNYEIPNTNPVILTAAGRQPNIFFPGVAKAILATSSGTQILVRDPVGETDSSFGNPWVASKEYNANSVVLGSDGQFYISLVNSNTNHDPVTSSGYWTFLYSVEWSAGTTYKVGSVVTYQTIVYQSLQNANLNKNPTTEAAWWVPINLAWISTATYGDGANVVGTDGILYVSQQAANINHDPSTDTGTWWLTSSAGAGSISGALNSGLATVNYKGQWSLLTGALNTPASVSHIGGTWLLLNNLANVTLSQPGATADWQLLAGLGYDTRSSNTIFAVVDNDKVIEFSGTFTQTFTSAVTLGTNWAICLMNTGTGDITLDPAGTETIDGLTTLVMYPGEVRIVRSNGTNFLSMVTKAFSKIFTSSGTFYPPSKYSQFRVGVQGGGGGGGSGALYSASNAGGGAGGGGGTYIECIRRSSEFSTSHTVTIGAGGTGGAARTVDGTNGLNGTDGGQTTLVSIATAPGGNLGAGGIVGSSTGGAYQNYISGFASTHARYVVSGSGGGGFTGTGTGGDSVSAGAAGGGGGGGCTTAPVVGNGGTGGARGASSNASAGAAATSIGGGGGGGNGRNTGAGFVGGAGLLGGGGGGGGGTLFAAASTSGAGGAGGDGYIYIEGIA